MVDLLREGKKEQAKEIHDRLMPLFKGAFVESNPIPIKYIKSKMGFGDNVLRLPLTPISAGAQEKIEQIISQYGL